MKADLAHKWVSILSQSRLASGALRRGENCFCVFGALCELFRKETGNGRWEKLTDLRWKFYWIGNEGVEMDSLGRPPEIVLDWAGLNIRHARHLMEQNDTYEIFDKEFILSLIEPTT